MPLKPAEEITDEEKEKIKRFFPIEPKPFELNEKDIEFAKLLNSLPQRSC